MEVLRKKVHIDKDGKLRLDLDTNFADCDAEIVLVLDKIGDKRYGFDVNKYSGALTFNEDPVEYQRKLRDEWER